MFCSTIIPTINRPTLSRAVESVLRQDLPEERFEIVVVNDSGAPLPDALWQRSPQVRVIHTQHRERSVARNTGAGIAVGKYLHFLDDDDFLLPGALSAFWETARTTQAGWLYAFWRTCDNEGRIVDEFRPELNGNVFALLVAGEGLPLQASLVRAEDFFEAGGFDSRSGILGVEDRDLGRRLALLGTIACVPVVGAQVRIGEVGSATKWSTLAEGDRLSREKALDLPNALRQVRASANSRYWRGRVCRALFGSALWNMRRKHFVAATCRVLPGMTLAAVRALSVDFWRGARGLQ
jgi:glycosyltransferase involved in cell wall biosynthesis